MDNDFNIINARKLDKLLKCEKAYEISEKNISGVYSKRYEFLMKSLKCLCGCLREGERASYEKIMDRLAPMFDREYSEEWFYCRAEHNALKDKDFRRFRRLAHFLEESGYVICQKDLCLTATLLARMQGYSFKSYSVRIDAVAERNGCKEAVIFSTEKPEYNNRATERRKTDRQAVWSLWRQRAHALRTIMDLTARTYRCTGFLPFWGKKAFCRKKGLRKRSTKKCAVMAASSR